MTDHSTGSDNTGSGAGERFVDDASRYRLDSRIATGGMGEVWRATDTALGREVAVKVLKSEYADDPTFRERFLIEARHAAALHHPGVAGVFDFGEAHDAGAADKSGVPRPFLVMELVEGEPLSTLLRQGLEAHRNLDRDAVRDLLAQAGEAIGAAHAAGIVHRDVKPANMMVTPDGQLKVTDFGIARAGDGAGMTQTGAVMGTPQYLSPEQAQGGVATPRSDVYSLGVVAFECLAGRRPFEAESPIATALAHIREPVPDLPDDVPDDLAAVVLRALAKDPADRYADGSAFAIALRDPATEVLNRPPVVPAAAAPPATAATQVLPGAAGVAGAAGDQVIPGTAPVPAASAATRSGKRGPWLAVVVTLLAVALAAAVVLLVLTGDDDPEAPPSDDSSQPTRTRQPSQQDTPTGPATPSEKTSKPPPEEPEPSDPETSVETQPTEPTEPTEPTDPPTTEETPPESPLSSPATSRSAMPPTGVPTGVPTGPTTP